MPENVKSGNLSLDVEFILPKFEVISPINFSEDVRTPVNALLSVIQVCPRNTKKEDRQNRYHEWIERFLPPTLEILNRFVVMIVVADFESYCSLLWSKVNITAATS